jgi:hypothetical protein
MLQGQEPRSDYPRHVRVISDAVTAAAFLAMVGFEYWIAKAHPIEDGISAGQSVFSNASNSTLPQLSAGIFLVAAYFGLCAGWRLARWLFKTLSGE